VSLESLDLSSQYCLVHSYSVLGTAWDTVVGGLLVVIIYLGALGKLKQWVLIATDQEAVADMCCGLADSASEHGSGVEVTNPRSLFPTTSAAAFRFRRASRSGRPASPDAQPQCSKRMGL
jgi:hypothetical protein